MATSTAHSRSSLVAGLVYFQLAAGMILFGSATPVSKLVTEAMPVFFGSTLRVAVGALVLAPLLLRHRGEIARLSRTDWMLTALISLFGMFGFTVFMLMGMSLVTGVVGAIVMSTTPAVTAAAAILLVGEQASWRKLAAIALAVGGVLLLYVSGGTGGSGGGSGGGPAMQLLQELGGGLLVGGALVFAAVCCEVAYTLLGQRVSRDVNPMVVAFLAAALSIPLFLPLAAWEWGSFDPAGVSVGGWLAVVWYGAGTLALGTWCWYSGIAKTEGSIAAAFMGLMPVSALVLSYLLLGEPFRWIHVVGFGVVFAGVLLMSWEHATMSKQHER